MLDAHCRKMNPFGALAPPSATKPAVSQEVHTRPDNSLPDFVAYAQSFLRSFLRLGRLVRRNLNQTARRRFPGDHLSGRRESLLDVSSQQGIGSASPKSAGKSFQAARESPL